MTDLPPSTDMLTAVRNNRAQFRNFGIAFVVIGVLAILFPLFFSVAAKIALGWVFLVTGAALLWHAFQAKGWQSALSSGLIGLIHLAFGVYLAFFALTGLIGLTLFLGAIFLAQGALETYMAFQHRGISWLMLNGIVTLVLGVLLIAGLPGTALWAIGLLLGINFLMTGVSFLALVRASDRT